MGLYEDLKKRLDSETFSKVVEQLGDDYDFNQVPYARLQKVIRERNDLRERVYALEDGGDPKGTPTKSTQKKNDEPGGSTLTQKDLDDAVNAAIAAKDKEIADYKIRTVALQQLRDAGCIDAELVFDSTKIDRDSLSLEKDGSLSGLEQQITSLKESSAALFAGNASVPSGTGKKGGEGQYSSKEDIASETFNAGLDAIFGISRAKD